MKKTKVIVCSNSGIDYLNHPYDIEVFRSIVQYSDTEKYDDYTEISAESFYNRLITDKESFPKTAYVTIGHMVEVFNKAKENGYERALVITIAKPLSGLNAAISLAAEQVEDFEVVAYDSKTLAYPESYMAIEAARMFEEGESLANVLKRLDYIRDNHHILFAVDTLEFLIKNGRLGKVAGAFANMLAIRPVLELDKDGRVVSLLKGRTSKGARKKMVELFLEETNGVDVIPFIVHANASKEVLEEVVAQIKEVRSEYKEIIECQLTPVVGAHSGPGAVCLGYIKK